MSHLAEGIVSMRWQRVFLIVTGCALAGMCMGGLFGFGAGSISPEIFRNVIPWKDVEPASVALALGSLVALANGRRGRWLAAG